MVCWSTKATDHGSGVARVWLPGGGCHWEKAPKFLPVVTVGGGGLGLSMGGLIHKGCVNCGARLWLGASVRRRV